MKFIQGLLSALKGALYFFLAGYVALNFLGESMIENWDEVGIDVIKNVIGLTVGIAIMEGFSNLFDLAERFSKRD